jgi:elongation factor G
MRVRNVAVVSHSGAGKTSLVEALLVRSGARDRLGRIEDGSTASDYTEAERRRKLSIATSVLDVRWRNTVINLLDAPGYADFVGEIRGAMRAADSVVVVVSSVSGVAVGTERVWRTADDFSLPRIVVINKMDRDRADFFGTVSELRQTLGGPVVAAFVPIGSESLFRGECAEPPSQPVHQRPRQPHRAARRGRGLGRRGSLTAYRGHCRDRR